MSFVEKRKEFRPARGEAPFGLDEVFFSRTDPRGVIQAGNYVFRRVAAYEWSQLIGAPHKVIRHPDMPRGVFWLMWNRLQAGQPIGAYVKNRAQDGLHYWVYAVIAPIDGGYLSARIKPTSALRDRIEREYAMLRAAERDDGLTPEASAERLCARLGELGFPDYETFAAHALGEELLERDRGLSLPGDPRMCALRMMRDAASHLVDETAALSKEFRAMRTIPHNMQVLASRLEPTGGPVSTLSMNYRAISHEMSDWFAQNVVGSGATFTRILGTVYSSMFLEGMARILRESDQQLQIERRALGTLDIQAERRIQAEQAALFTARSRTGLAQVRDEAGRILRACEVMQRHVLGLSSTRVLCKIESRRTAGAQDALSGIIGQLGDFQERITVRLERIEAECRQILARTG
ncbi:chemotaxis protein [Sinisalibacter aestuarii]|uniref:PAS domain-containing protein n=1 Tax=Sinisalibacter aestuarii TaxID=2949426 RepID=A0ABQ5LWR6_9RHOB|nr:chemotaxis protein [Sinisalibacter aestuarii]GKY88721.1 hypothetical protein STA1M1_25900 [Sinisalibacter aestuarii]